MATNTSQRLLHVGNIHEETLPLPQRGAGRLPVAGDAALLFDSEKRAASSRPPCQKQIWTSLGDIARRNDG